MTFLESDINPNVIEEFREAYERAQIRKNRNMWKGIVVWGAILAVAWWASR